MADPVFSVVVNGKTLYGDAAKRAVSLGLPVTNNVNPVVDPTSFGSAMTPKAFSDAYGTGTTDFAKSFDALSPEMQSKFGSNLQDPTESAGLSGMDKAKISIAGVQAGLGALSYFDNKKLLDKQIDQIDTNKKLALDQYADRKRGTANAISAFSKV